MARPTVQNIPTAGQDSFLDIVTNIVGILIILVVVAGIRAENAPADPQILAEQSSAALAALQDEQARAGAMRADVMKLADQIAQVRGEALRRMEERDFLATAAAALEKKIELRRSSVDSEAQKRFDLARSFSESRAELDRLTKEKRQATSAQEQTAVIESLSTPLGKTVDENEAHFQLRGGRIVLIPLDSLLDQFKDDAKQKAYQLLDLKDLTNTVGPEGGFRLRYTLELRTIPPDIAMRKGYSGQYAQLRRWTLIPVSADLGETLPQALAEGSAFRRDLARFTPGETTVTIWTYPDGFAEFRELKKELHRLGYATAARPLPHDTPIGGSPEGSKSAAE